MQNLSTLTSLVNQKRKEVLSLDLDKVISKKQVRVSFNDLEGLATSLLSEGQQTPITVSAPDIDGIHTVILGERRFRAAKQAGLKTIEAIINDVSLDNTERTATQLIENIQRDELTFLEIAEALLVLIDAGYTQTRAAERIGKKPWYVSEHLSVFSLPDNLLSICRDGIINDLSSIRILRRIVEQDSPEGLDKLYDRIRTDGGMSRSDLKSYLDGLTASKENTEVVDQKGTTHTERDSEETTSVTSDQVKQPKIDTTIPDAVSEKGFFDRTPAAPAPVMEDPFQKPKGELLSGGQPVTSWEKVTKGEVIIEVIVTAGEGEFLAKLLLDRVANDEQMVWVAPFDRLQPDIESAPRMVKIDSIILQKVHKK